MYLSLFSRVCKWLNHFFCIVLFCSHPFNQVTNENNSWIPFIRKIVHFPLKFIYGSSIHQSAACIHQWIPTVLHIHNNLDNTSSYFLQNVLAFLFIIKLISSLPCMYLSAEPVRTTFTAQQIRIFCIPWSPPDGSQSYDHHPIAIMRWDPHIFTSATSHNFSQSRILFHAV